MLKNKVTEFLSALTPDELKRFGEFISSSYFNKNLNSVKLFKELKKHYPGFSDRTLSNEYLYKKVISNKGYNMQVIRNLNSNLMKLAKDFLAVEKLFDNETDKSLSLLAKLQEKKLGSFFNSELKDLEESLLRKDDLTHSTFLNLYRMESERLNFLIENDRQNEAVDYILKQSEYLVFHFLIHLSNAKNNIKINEDAFNVKFDVNLVKEFIANTNIKSIVEFINKNEYEFAPLILIHYYKMMCSLYPENEEYYFKLKEFLYKNIPFINKLELYSIITAMEVYCTSKLAKGEAKFYKELFEIYKLTVNYGTFLKGSPPRITAIKFRNIYTCAFRVGEYDWAKNFVDTHQDFLSEEGKIISELAYSQFDFQMKDYDSAMERLNSIKTDLYYAKKDVRRFMLQIHYERDHLESALSLLGSSRQFINNNSQIIPGVKDSFIKYINVMTALVKLKSSPDTKKLALLKKKVESDSLPSREWILEKISELQ